MEYHEKLRQFIKSKGITYTEAGDRMGYSQVMMSKYVNKAYPNFEFLTRLGEVFPDIDMNYLLKSDTNNNLLVMEPDTGKYGKSQGIIEEIEEKLKELKKSLSQK